jgi:hypothetical protein
MRAPDSDANRHLLSLHEYGWSSQKLMERIQEKSLSIQRYECGCSDDSAYHDHMIRGRSKKNQCLLSRNCVHIYAAAAAVKNSQEVILNAYKSLSSQQQQPAMIRQWHANELRSFLMLLLLP